MPVKRTICLNPRPRKNPELLAVFNPAKQKPAKTTKRPATKRKAPAAAIVKATRTKQGKAAAARYKKFWGIPPAQVKTYKGAVKGMAVIASLGRSPGMYIANGPLSKATTITRTKHNGTLATDANGRRLMVLVGRHAPDLKSLKPVGYAASTEYIPTRAMEKAGTFKKGARWIHHHSESGGHWPRLYRDRYGNYVYSTGTYRVGEWIRR